METHSWSKKTNRIDAIIGYPKPIFRELMKAGSPENTCVMHNLKGLGVTMGKMGFYFCFHEFFMSYIVSLFGALF